MEGVVDERGNRNPSEEGGGEGKSMGQLVRLVVVGDVHT
jgi:hypothetical protein